TKARRITVPPAHTVQVPGGTQALRRTELVSVRLGRRRGTLPRPNLLGAILVKTRAVDIDDVPENQRLDLALLLSFVDDADDRANRLGRHESHRDKRGEGEHDGRSVRSRTGILESGECNFQRGPPTQRVAEQTSGDESGN